MREQVKVAADSTADDKRRLESEHATLQRAADNWERERREAAAALRHERVALDAMREQREKVRAVRRCGTRARIGDALTRSFPALSLAR
jgi:hypothetical protein